MKCCRLVLIYLEESNTWQKKLGSNQTLLNNLDLLAKKDLKQLKKVLKVDDIQLQEIVKSLTGLTPKPGLIYGKDSGVEVTPDVLILKDSLNSVI